MSEQPTTQPIEIPKALSDKLPDGGHYVRLRRGEKTAIDLKWSTEPRPLNDPELQEWIRQGNNYGVVGGFGLIIIDVDDDELKQAAQEKLPSTFTAQTPGHNGWHMYYLGTLDRPIRLSDGKNLDEHGNPKSVGEISAEGRQVVGPGSIHPNGKTYTILKDVALAKVTRQQIESAFRPWIVHEKKPRKEEAEEENEAKKRGIDIDITDVFDCEKHEGFKQHGDQWQGAHPVHGSETGGNFNVNVKKNVWHCFRCDSGGGPLELLAVLEKIADCKDFAKGAHILKTNKQLWQQVRDRAVQKGIVDKDAFIAKAGNEGNQAERLVGYVLGSMTLFHDNYNEGYVQCTNNTPIILKIRSPGFKDWASLAFYETENKVIGPEALNSAISVLEGKAKFDKQMIRLYNRVAPDWDGDGFWYDLSDEVNRAVHITSAGWQVVDEPPILFRRYDHQIPQVTPTKDGNIKDILEFFAPAIKDKPQKDGEEETQLDPEMSNQALMIMVDLVSKFIPEIPHEFEEIYGPPGAAKTSLGYFTFNRLVDPSAIDNLSLPDRRELTLILDQHYAPFFDNVSYLSKKIQDDFSRAVTGSGNQRRRLYTDEDGVIRKFKRPIGISSLSQVVTHRDLLDRTSLIETKRIEDSRRKEEAIINADFEARRPGILGSIFTILSKAIEIHETSTVRDLPRMADYCHWCCDIAEALGYSGEEFYILYRKRGEKQVDEAIRGSEVVGMLLSYLDNRRDTQLEKPNLVYAGNATDLLGQLKAVAEGEGIDTSKNNKEWPKKANRLSAILGAFHDDLLKLGYKVVTGRISRAKRYINIEKVSSLSSPSSQEAETQTAQASTPHYIRDGKPRASSQKPQGSSPRRRCGPEVRIVRDDTTSDRDDNTSSIVSEASHQDVGHKAILERGDDRDDRDDEKRIILEEGGKKATLEDIEQYLREDPSHSIGFTALCEEFGLSDKQLDAFIEESNFLTTVLNSQVVKYQEPRQFNCEKCGERLVFEAPPNPTGEEASFSIECESCHTQNIFVYGQNGIVQTKLVDREVRQDSHDTR